MANEKEKQLELVISAYTKGVEAGMAKIREDLTKLRDSTTGWSRELSAASNALDVRPAKLVEEQVAKLRNQYDLLKNSGKLSQQELARAWQSLQAKTADLNSEQGRVNSSLQKTGTIASSLTGNVTRLAAAYLSWRTVASLYSGITTAAREAETAQFGLTASVEAASREFSNTGSVDTWQASVSRLSQELRIFSESELKNATARTIDMTKRLGLSAEQMEELIRRTADLSAGKTDLEGGIERVTSALRGEAEASEFLGLTLSETYVKGWYASNAATEKAWKDLTEMEKAQVRYQVLLEQTDALQGRAAESTGTFDGALKLVKSRLADAVANNEDFSRALRQVAELLADNADEIAQLATALTSGIGTLAQFILQNKELVGVLIGGGGLVAAISKTSQAVDVLQGSLKVLGAAKTPDLLSSSGAVNAALLARIGLIGSVGVAVAGVYAGYKSWEIQQNRVADAAERVQQQAQKTIETLQQYRDLQPPSEQNLFDADIERLKTLQTEMKAAREYWGATLADLQAQMDVLLHGKDQDWVKNTGRYKELSAAIAEAAEKLASYDRALVETAAAEKDHVAAAEAQALAIRKAGDAAVAAVNPARILAEATAAHGNEIDKVRDKVSRYATELVSAEIDLARAAAAGGEEHAAALKKRQQALESYVTEATRLRDMEFTAFEKSLRSEEIALDISYDARMIALEDDLNNEYITKREYDLRRLEAEQEHAEAVLALRESMYQQAAQQYGADSDRAIAALEEVRFAENDVTRATNATEQAFDSLAEGTRRAGEEGHNAGRMGRAGMDMFRDGVVITRQELEDLIEQQGLSKEQAREMVKEWRAAKESVDEARKSQWEAFKEARNKQIASDADDIANTIKGLTTADALQEWAQMQTPVATAGAKFDASNADRMYGGVPGTQNFNAMNRYARDLFLEQQKQIELNAAAEKEAQARALRQQIAADQQASAIAKVAAARADQAAAVATTGTTTASSTSNKTMTVNLKAGSASTTVSLPQTDAGKLLDVLKQAGMTTA